MDTLNHNFAQVRLFINHSSGTGWSEPAYAEINVDPSAVRYSEVASDLNVFININGRQGEYNRAGLEWLHKQVGIFILGQSAMRNSLMLMNVSQWQSNKVFYFQGFPQVSYRMESKPDVIALSIASTELLEWKFRAIKDTAASGRNWRHVQA